ncbi:MAG: GNAT family N-acetyltransferase [Brevundimonas sp.]|uniref:N-acetyltransferase n=1 Tax=Brevundimonas sp. TaxID=1871086 RepID=UPI002560D1A9|nr:N-acetyltransferase [Brevundimonas sp.]MDK2747616.1 GNAT family N-acetyltransferase [Brevundimonas sp.]
MSVRPIRRSDYEALNRLHRQVGWPERSQAGWRWLEDNPARRDIDAPFGWVVADRQDEPVAMLGNLIQRFCKDDERLYAATGFSIIVPPERAGASRYLIKAILAQPNLFACYTLNANPRSAPLYKLFGFQPGPMQTHALKLSWVVDPATCLKGRLLRRLLGGISAEQARRLGEPLMNARLFQPPRLKLPDDVVVLRDVTGNSPYADFWRALTAEGRLLADRGPEIMAWRLSDPDQTLPPILLGRVRDGRLVGTAMAMMTKTSLIEPPCLDIIDLTALKTAPEAIEVLTGVLIDNARALGAAKVRLQVTNPDILDQLGALTPKARREGGWGHCHARVDDPVLAETWAPTPFDGDYAVCARAVPAPRAQHAPVRVSAVQGQFWKA